MTTIYAISVLVQPEEADGFVESISRLAGCRIVGDVYSGRVVVETTNEGFALGLGIEFGDKPQTRREKYAEYLASGHWRSLRQWALERADGRCQVCNGEAKLQVHHRTYVRIGAELPGDLIVLCDSCHSTFHKNGRLA